MYLPLKDQTVFISGAGRGLGSFIAKSFYREGAKVIINYRKSYDEAKSLCESLGENSLILQGDVRDRDDVSKMHET